jgi:hypothetical protein
MDTLTETLSDDPEQKLHALMILVDSHNDREELSPGYVMACGNWYAMLSDRQKLAAISAAQTFDLGNEERALEIAAGLPPVPRL